jgi:type II secretion system protein G
VGRRKHQGLLRVVRRLTILCAIGGAAFLLLPQPSHCDFTRGRSRVAKLQIANFRNALEAFYQDHGFYPDTDAGLAALVSSGYLRKVPRHPWDAPYEYSMYGSHYVLRSFGADHRFGGAEGNSDIDRFVVIGDET